jgi:hypothetical protein
MCQNGVIKIYAAHKTLITLQRTCVHKLFLFFAYFIQSIKRILGHTVYTQVAVIDSTSLFEPAVLCFVYLFFRSKYASTLHRSPVTAHCIFQQKKKKTNIEKFKRPLYFIYLLDHHTTSCTRLCNISNKARIFSFNFLISLTNF